MVYFFKNIKTVFNKYKILIWFIVLKELIGIFIFYICSNPDVFNGYIYNNLYDNRFINWLNSVWNYKGIGLGYEILNIPSRIIYPIVIYYLFKKFYKQLNINYKEVFKFSFWRAMYVSVFIVGVLILLFLFFNLFFNNNFNIQVSPLYDFFSNLPYEFLTKFNSIIIDTSTVAPISEELLYRLIIFIGFFYKSKSLFKSLIISSIIFIMGHHIFYDFDFNFPYLHFAINSGNLKNFIMSSSSLFCFSIIVCLLLIITRNPITIIIYHSLDNILIAVLKKDFAPLIKVSCRSILFKHYSYFFSALIIALILIIYLYRNKHLLKKFYEIFTPS